MSPADERRHLVQAAQRREPFRSDDSYGGEPSVHASLYPAERRVKNRGWTFVAVSAALVVGALGVCWLFASSDSIAQWINGSGERSATTEVTSAPADKPVDVAALPNAAAVNAVPTTVQPASVPAAPPVLEATPTPKVAPATPPPVLEAASKVAPAGQAGPSTIRVVESPEPEATPAADPE